MKTTHFILKFVIVLIFSITTGIAQMNVFKLNATALAFTNFQVSYERVLSQHNSFGLSVSYAAPGFLPYRNVITFDFNERYLDNPVEKMEFSGMGVMPEFRFYLSDEKDAPRRFYIAPYIKYASYQINSVFRYQEDSIGIANMTLDGKTSFIGGGIAIGYQFIIGESFSIDLWFLGLGGANGKTEATIVSENLKQDLYGIIEDDFKDVEKFYGHYTIQKVSEDEVDMTANGLMPCLKMGITLGLCL